jgi:hypothetical protein
MARYYLHLRQGQQVALDQDGVEFHDQVTVELEAMRAAARAWRQMQLQADPRGYALDIMNEAGHSVLTIPISDALMAVRVH